MKNLALLAPRDRPLRLLCLGAHSDDIEIGCGGTILRLLRECGAVSVRWVVFSANGERAREAERGASLFLEAAAERAVQIHEFRDGYFPFQGSQIKDQFESLKRYPPPDVIFTHHREDRHQDHRLISDLTWNTFRDHLILEYEIPKYDGGLTTPNLYVALSHSLREEKVAHLMSAFGSQRDKRWFDEGTFLGLARLRGIESATPEGFAEGFFARKTTLLPLSGMPDDHQ